MKKIKFDAEAAVAMYKAGTGISDIAVAMGYERGSGQNRTRAALAKAGVWKAESAPRKRGRMAAAAGNTAPLAVAINNGGTAHSNVTDLRQWLDNLAVKLDEVKASLAVAPPAAQPAPETGNPVQPAIAAAVAPMALPVPTGKEVAMRACYLFVEGTYKKLIGRQRTGFVQELSGLLLAGLANADGVQKITPVAVPEQFKLAAA